MPESVRCALVQTVNAYRNMPSGREDMERLKGHSDRIREENIRYNVSLIEQAVSDGARAVCLNELFPAPYFCLEEDEIWRDFSEDAASGPTVRALSRTAGDLGVVLIAPLYEHDRDVKKYYSTAVVISDRGIVLGKYRKAHIPRGENEAGRVAETFYFDKSGEEPYFPVFKTAVGKIGICLGYDRHFDGVFAAYARAGAEIVFAPSVAFSAKAKEMWEPEIRVSAARHRLFIGVSNRLGVEKPWNRFFFGSSFFAGPDGEKLENRSNHPNLVVTSLDLETLRYPDPAGWNLRRDARRDIY